MGEIDQDQKTEQPSEKRLNEAAERGQFAKTPELAVLFSIAALLGALAFALPAAARDIAEYATAMFTGFAHSPVSRDTVPLQLGEMILVGGRALLPFLAGCLVAALLAGGVQSGLRLSPEAIGLKFENLDPVAGFGRVFSKAALIRAGLDLLKLAGIGGVLFLGTRALLVDPLFSVPVDASYLGQFLNHATLVFLGRLLLALGIVAALGYGYEKFKTARELMMTRQEVKEERKGAEGDGHTKAAMRRMARRLLQKQMLSAVATADVVVTNPTHYAVALRYERGRDRAPVILAKGENRFAQRIKALAAEHGVPVIENKPVARVLFALGRVDEVIPAELYQAVAQILAVVYRTHRYYFHRLRSRRLEAAS